MLLQFSVENYRSFKNLAVLSFEASNDKDLPNNITVLGKERCLNTVAIFGANAAGKSNIFYALTAAIRIIRRSNVIQINEPLSDIVPYRFSPESANNPTSFEFVFIAQGKKYVYGFSATKEAIRREYLYVFNTSKASTVFERCSPKEFIYTSRVIKRELKPIEERNTDNKLFLATATMWNCEITKVPFLWFQNQINTYPANFDVLFNQVAPLFQNDEDDSLKHFTTELLRQADLNVDDYEFEAKKLPAEQIPQNLKTVASTLSVTVNKLIRINTVHMITDGNATQRYKIGLKEESQGTRYLFLFSPVLKRAFENGETVCIDNFGSGIHPMLVVYLAKLFNNPDVNKNHAQLLVSTHAMALLSLENLRRDQIYFVEKDRDTGVSEFYSLDDFSPRKQEDVRKAYLLGRYGSVPDISEGTMLWE